MLKGNTPIAPPVKESLGRAEPWQHRLRQEHTDDDDSLDDVCKFLSAEQHLICYFFGFFVCCWSRDVSISMFVTSHAHFHDLRRLLLSCDVGIPDFLLQPLIVYLC